MCYNYDVSIGTFIVGLVGSIYNIIEFRDNSLFTLLNIF